jgi:hypothetical protein
MVQNPTTAFSKQVWQRYFEGKFQKVIYTCKGVFTQTFGEDNITVMCDMALKSVQV